MLKRSEARGARRLRLAPLSRHCCQLHLFARGTNKAANKAVSRSPVNNNSSPDARVGSKAANRVVAVSKAANRASRIVRLSFAKRESPGSHRGIFIARFMAARWPIVTRRAVVITETGLRRGTDTGPQVYVSLHPVRQG